MATIRSLVVNLSANSAQLTSELGKSRKMLGDWAKNSIVFIGNVAKQFVMLGAVAATAFAGMVTYLTVSNAKAIKSIDTLAKSFGVAVEDMQKWIVAGNDVGLTADKIGSIFKNTSKNISQFVTSGKGAAKDVFEQLRLDAADFINLAPDKAILKINEAMDGLNQQDKVSLFEKLASGSSALLPLLNNNAEGFKALADEAEKAGVILSKSKVDGVVAFDDALGKLKLNLSGFGRTLAGTLAPALTVIVEKITATIKEMGGMKPVAEAFARFAINAMIAVVQGISGAVTALQELILTLKRAQLMYMIMDNLAGKLVPFGEDYSPAQLQAVANDILAMEKRIAEGSGVKQSLIDFMDKLRETVDQAAPIGANDLKLADGSRDYDSIIKMVEAANNVTTANQRVASSANDLAETLKAASESKAWKDIFGTQEVTARANQFDDYAKLVKNNIDSGSSFAASDLKTLKSILETSVNNGGTGYSNNGLFEQLDIKGMETVINGLEAMLKTNQTVMQNDQPKTKISIDLTSDTGNLAGEIWAEPEFIRRLEAWNKNYMNDVSRGVTS